MASLGPDFDPTWKGVGIRQAGTLKHPSLILRWFQYTLEQYSLQNKRAVRVYYVLGSTNSPLVSFNSDHRPFLLIALTTCKTPTDLKPPIFSFSLQFCPLHFSLFPQFHTKISVIFTPPTFLRFLTIFFPPPVQLEPPKPKYNNSAKRKKKPPPIF